MIEPDAEANAEIRRLLLQLDQHAAGEAAHANRVAVFAVATGQQLGLQASDLLKVRYAATLHDLGKLSIPAELLKKQGALNQTELEVLREHAEAGAAALAPRGWASDILDSVQLHHERWDGSGYPKALRGESIPLMARIVAAAEAFDAVAYPQPYRSGQGEEAGIKVLMGGSGSQFDPEVVAAFFKVQPLIQPILIG